LSKLLLINYQKEYNYYQENIKRFKDYRVLILQPEINIKKTDKIFFSSEFINRKNFFFPDIFFRKKLDYSLKLLNQEFVSFFKFSKINFLTNYGHNLKSLTNVIISHFEILDNLIKKHKVKEVNLFYYPQNLKNPEERLFYYILNSSYFNNIKLKSITFSNRNNNFLTKKYYNLVPSFKEESFSYKRELINQIKIKNFRANKKKNILFSSYSKNIYKIAQNLSKKFNIIFYDKVFFLYKKTFIKKEKIDFFFKKLKKNKLLISKFIFYKKYPTLEVIEYFLRPKIPEIVNINFYHYYKTQHILKKYKLSAVLSEYETNKNIQIFEQTHMKIKNIFFSHGGTLGHYKDWPQLNLYNRGHLKNLYYQTFSKDIKNYLLRSFKLLKKRPCKFIQFPPLDGIRFKDNKKKLELYKKKIRIGYFCTNYSGNYESKIDLHDDYNLFTLRLKIISQINKSNNITLHIKPGYNNKSLDISFLKEKNNKFKYYKDNYPNEKIFQENDLIISEVNSTTLIEALHTDIPIIVFKKSYPRFLKKSFELLKKRVVFCSNEKSILRVLSKLDKKGISFFKENKIDLKDKKFINTFYDYKNLKLNYITEKISKIIL